MPEQYGGPERRDDEDSSYVGPERRFEEWRQGIDNTLNAPEVGVVDRLRELRQFIQGYGGTHSTGLIGHLDKIEQDIKDGREIEQMHYENLSDRIDTQNTRIGQMVFVLATGLLGAMVAFILGGGSGG